ncbi:two pore domain potassium channel family protein [Tenacibaculum finnmarkense]|uniref:potassium channel family protein n=1 Tax=Tenacibaculum TaxID=104267 RepID=UPI00187B91DE|nr:MULTISPECIES: potassium channel family protein [Tenacibaculum]MCD8425937.1 potassium channel family protein [Tenacibaculum dicentrarchi]MBE7688972.1 two pore domain potassium channel family protein [Tenacibaculum finnmarkense genomovar ulcerans]MBE7693609.1 two pore domain potassium channel family protein [Tenacibaculum finnmarkense genomovar finnmarkense]MCD8410994.1 potassium channel family protein [Tenacibaculum finnmarkense genomovar ulcerans]MCG8184415.1 two pore domain potassium chann
MPKENTVEKSKSTDFYKQLFKKVILTTSIVIASSLSYTLWIVVDSDSIFLPFLIVSLAFFKTIFIVKLTFTQLSKIIGESHQLTHILTLFGILIILIVLSFSADYQALYILNSENFKFETIPNNSFLLQFFEFLYFSFITFSSVGYGDIVPISIAGKLIVILEVVLSFFVLVFGIANINRIHVNK